MLSIYRLSGFTRDDMHALRMVEKKENHTQTVLM